MAVVNLIGSGGQLPLSFALMGEDFTDSSTYSELSAGANTFLVRDAAECTTEWTVDIPSTPHVEITDLTAEQLFCGDVLSEIQFNRGGGTGNLTTRIYDNSGQLVDQTLGLPEGQYRLTITDELGCEATDFIMVRKEECQMYIPTIFGLNSDSDDQVFKPGVPAASGFLITTFQIYDRWGNLVYNKENIDPLTFTEWWDGTFNGRDVEQGVYLYVIELGGESAEIIRGTITVIR